ncbi:LysR family transcriptional regulator [Nocardia sp. NBC_01377]|uniref:LysR family transcriptional regulator n=1 Tax=Nocardia sp. NBC_01377 TaxID=2903595 RepID=UPI003244BD23
MKLGQVDLNLLVVLDALLREQNVTRAAERLHMTQPATSTALSRLRKVLGDPLLIKQGRHMRLTPRAESLIEPVRDVLATIEQTIVRPTEFDPASNRRVFTLCASDYIGVVLIRPLLGRIASLAPDIRLNLTSIHERYLNALRRDEVDLAILPDRLTGIDRLIECSSTPVLSDRFVGAVWAEHPRAGERLTAELLSEYPYLAYEPPAGYSVIEEDLEQAGIPRRVEATVTNFTLLPFMLARTQLVTVVPERLGRRVAAAAEITLLEPDIEFRPLRQSAYWHSRHDADPGHRWLREQLLSTAHSEALDPASTN